MEVHHHSHTERKKWAHYFWEFLMLFLAVFCGYLAEYKLEHNIEKGREKQYIESILQDLEADAITLQNRIGYCDLTVNQVDSLIALLKQGDRKNMAGDIYYFLHLLHRSDVFRTNDKTIVQLRNAGGMRLLSNKVVSDTIIAYYQDVDFIRFLYEEQTEFRRSLRPLFPKILDGSYYGYFLDSTNAPVRSNEAVQLRITDPDVINTLLITLANIRGINNRVRKVVGELKERAKITRAVIIKEYHLSAIRRTTLEK